MARSVYNIDFYTLIYHRYVLGKDGYTSFPFNVIVVENQFPEIFRLSYKVVSSAKLVYYIISLLI